MKSAIKSFFTQQNFTKCIKETSSIRHEPITFSHVLIFNHLRLVCQEQNGIY